jgi:predicted nucleic acid-binding protein
VPIAIQTFYGDFDLAKRKIGEFADFNHGLLGQTAYQMLETIGLQTDDSEIAVSVVTVLELAHGIIRADTSQRRLRRQQFLDDLLTGVPVHPVTVPIALRAGQIDGQMQAAGTRIALADLLIAVTALELGHLVATANTRHFKLIPNLAIRQF